MVPGTFPMHAPPNGYLLLLFLTLLDVSGAELLRGPYLQLPTHESMVLRWRTDVPVGSRVVAGSGPGDYALTVQNSIPVTQHEIKISGLDPDTRYFYRVGTDTGYFTPASDSFSFQTSPIPGTLKSTRVWALGDVGTGDANAAAVRDAFYAFNEGPSSDVWILLGDNAYPNGTDAEYQNALFENMFTPTLTRTPMWSAYGNHDGYSANALTQTGPYFDIFTFPTQGEAGGTRSGTEAYFSHDYGNIHFVNLSSYQTDLTADSEMLTWLREDLAANESAWTVAYWHHPPYSRGSHYSDYEYNLIQMRQVFVPVLEEYGVDLVLSGHSHSYERSYLINGHYGNSQDFDTDPGRFALDLGSGRPEDPGEYVKLKENAPGTIYIVAGSAGKTSGGALDHPAMFYSENSLGSLVLDFSANRMQAQFLNSGGEIADWFSLTKGSLLDLSPSKLDFYGIEGYPLPDSQVITVSSEEGAPHQLSAVSNEEWLEVRVDANAIYHWAHAKNLPPGDYRAEVTVRGEFLLPATYPVTLMITTENPPQESENKRPYAIDVYYNHTLTFVVLEKGDYTARLLTMAGRKIWEGHGSQKGNHLISGPNLTTGPYLWELRFQNRLFREWVLIR